MIRQVNDKNTGMVARVELLGPLGDSAVKSKDLDFFANLLMAMALSDRESVERIERMIAKAVQGTEGVWE